MRWAKRDDLDPATLPTRLKKPLRICIVRVDIQSRDCPSFWKNSVSDSVRAEKIGLFIPFILLTFLKVSFRRLRMSSRETIRLPFSSNWTGPVMPAISTFRETKKKNNDYCWICMKKLASEEGAWQNFIFRNWTRLLRRGCRANFWWQIAPKVKIGNFIPIN